MAKNVTTKYTPSLNISTTKDKGGRIVKVTAWTTGVPGSTERVHGK